MEEAAQVKRSHVLIVGDFNYPNIGWRHESTPGEDAVNESPFILNNSVETAAPFNVVSHPRCSEPRN